MANKTLFEEIVKSAESSPKHRWHLGGNAPAMVLRLAKEGLDVMLSARLTQDIVDRLPKEVKGTVILFLLFCYCYYFLLLFKLFFFFCLAFAIHTYLEEH